MKSYLTTKWITATILAILAVLVMVRLGFWQLDRLAQRRAYNARITAQQNAPVLALDRAALGNPDLIAQLKNMEYRQVKVEGSYDASQQVVLRNQTYDQQFGVDLLTPLHIEGSTQSILVDRGWIPQADVDGNQLSKYNRPGTMQVQGIIRNSQTRPEIGNLTDTIPAPGQGRLDTWNMVNLTGIAQQMPYPLLPVYLEQMPMVGDASGPPYAQVPQLDLTEGPHLGYAIQWFTFATLLAAGFPLFVSRELKKEAKSDRGVKVAS